MSNIYKVVRVTKPTKHQIEMILTDARDKFRVGDWIKLTRIGRIVSATSSITNDNLDTKIDVVEDFWNRDSPPAPQIERYECQKCFTKFNFLYEVQDHYDATHKRKPKSKTGGKNVKSKTKSKNG